MTSIDEALRRQYREWFYRWYQGSVSRRHAVRRLGQLLGSTAGRRGLCVLADRVVVSHALLQRGGNWSCVSILEDPGPAAVAVAGPMLKGIREGRFPFPDGTFDVVLMDQVLEYVPEDRAAVAECHRVLKPEGVLVVSAAVAKRWSLIHLARRLTGMDTEAGQVTAARPGYTESALFDVLKDGFDAEEAIRWSRFFSEAAELLVQLMVRLTGASLSSDAGPPDDPERWLMQCRRVVRLHRLLDPLARLVSALDVLVFFASGNRLAFRARRRAWRPRRAPSLRDGRSIADAAINTKIGTAAPF